MKRLLSVIPAALFTTLALTSPATAQAEGAYSRVMSQYAEMPDVRTVSVLLAAPEGRDPIWKQRIDRLNRGFFRKYGLQFHISHIEDWDPSSRVLTVQLQLQRQFPASMLEARDVELVLGDALSEEWINNMPQRFHPYILLKEYDDQAEESILADTIVALLTPFGLSANDQLDFLSRAIHDNDWSLSPEATEALELMRRNLTLPFGASQLPDHVAARYVELTGGGCADDPRVRAAGPRIVRLMTESESPAAANQFSSYLRKSIADCEWASRNVAWDLSQAIIEHHRSLEKVSGLGAAMGWRERELRFLAAGFYQQAALASDDPSQKSRYFQRGGDILPEYGLGSGVLKSQYYEQAVRYNPRDNRLRFDLVKRYRERGSMNEAKNHLKYIANTSQFKDERDYARELLKQL